MPNREIGVRMSLRVVNGNLRTLEEKLVHMAHYGLYHAEDKSAVYQITRVGNNETQIVISYKEGLDSCVVKVTQGESL